ncbi:MAG: hypothetical protein NTX88_06690 [Candidatus Atribacteria bacterium]|nr:hypothetical protein [Candidatus Atribacteria bacterium]
MTSRIVLVICLLILVSLLTFSVRGVSQTGDLGQEITQQVLELEKMKKEQTKLDQELRNLEKTQKNVLSEIGKIDQQIGKLEKDITTSRKRITELEGERKRLKKDIGGLSQDITATRSKVFQAMVRAYKNNTSIDFWSVFMGSANPAETEEQWYLFQKYSDYELAIITKYLGQKKSLQNKLKEVEQRIRLEAVLKEKLVLEDKNVKRLKETKNAMLSQVICRSGRGGAPGQKYPGIRKNHSPRPRSGCYHHVFPYGFVGGESG